MTKTNQPSATRVREELLQLMSVSGTMAGLCIMGVTLLYTADKTSSIEGTVVDDILALCALVFLLCTYFVFWALRTRRPTLAERLDKVSDLLFSLALTGMVVAGFIMVLEVW